MVFFIMPPFGPSSPSPVLIIQYSMSPDVFSIFQSKTPL